jgi:hypothetical protein
MATAQSKQAYAQAQSAKEDIVIEANRAEWKAFNQSYVMGSTTEPMYVRRRAFVKKMLFAEMVKQMLND